MTHDAASAPRGKAAVQILLSTYNGEAYLGALLESLAAQEHRALEILARDDGSSDGTLALLRTFQAIDPRLACQAGEHVGPARSFLEALRSASPNAEYFAFCDQDDVWLTGKVSQAVERLQPLGDELPVLYCSRVTITDEALRPIRLSDIPRRGLSFRNALVECPVWGCTVVINRPARNLLLRAFPAQACMHDAWMYLVVSAFGRVVYDERSTLLHRRHTRNVSDIPLTGRDRWKVQVRRMVACWGKQPVIQQAEELRRIFGAMLPEEHAKVLERFLESRRKLTTRLCYAMHGEVYHQSRLGNLMLRVLLALDRLHS